MTQYEAKRFASGNPAANGDRRELGSHGFGRVTFSMRRQIGQVDAFKMWESFQDFPGSDSRAATPIQKQFFWRLPTKIDVVGLLRHPSANRF